MKALHVTFEGRVQGVGFRYTVKRESTGFDVAGWVRNLPDGRVEMLVSGEDNEVDDFIEAILTGEMAGNIAKVQREETETDEKLRGFEIRL